MFWISKLVIENRIESNEIGKFMSLKKRPNGINKENIFRRSNTIQKMGANRLKKMKSLNLAKISGSKNSIIRKRLIF